MIAHMSTAEVEGLARPKLKERIEALDMLAALLAFVRRASDAPYCSSEIIPARPTYRGGQANGRRNRPATRQVDLTQVLVMGLVEKTCDGSCHLFASV